MLLLVNWFVVISAWWQHWDWMYQYKNCENNVFFREKHLLQKKLSASPEEFFFSKFMQILKIPFREILFFSKVSQLITIILHDFIKEVCIKEVWDSTVCFFRDVTVLPEAPEKNGAYVRKLGREYEALTGKLFSRLNLLKD